MKLKIITIGSFFVIAGGLTVLLYIVTNSIIFEPTFPPILAMSAGGILMAIGLALP